MSTGANEGVGIGVAVGLLLVLLAALFLIKRRKTKQVGTSELDASYAERKLMPELSGTNQAACIDVVEEAACARVVMVAYELDGKMRKAELDGTGTTHTTR
jgi:LPXTG-motif cell wall-anchored protein